jgi:hypothetical protein
MWRHFGTPEKNSGPDQPPDGGNCQISLHRQPDPLARPAVRPAYGDVQVPTDEPFVAIALGGCPAIGRSKQSSGRVSSTASRDAVVIVIR